MKMWYLLSSAFALWKGEGAERKSRFVVNFSIQRKFWDEGSVKIEKMDEFASKLKEGDRLLSLYLAASDHHVHLHPLMHE